MKRREFCNILGGSLVTSKAEEFLVGLKKDGRPPLPICGAHLDARMDTQAVGSDSNWHQDAFFGIHNDLHATAFDTELGRELTPQLLRERLLRTRPDWIQTDCKGHPGYTSWPTRVGSTSPGVVKDALRIYRDVTRELGIKLGVHYSGLFDMRAIELHPEWGRIDASGRGDKKVTCRLHGYDKQLMIPQMMEIIDKYDVDGFWTVGSVLTVAPRLAGSSDHFTSAASSWRCGGKLLVIRKNRSLRLAEVILQK